MLQLEQGKGLPQLAGRWMSVAALQTSMVNAGINVFVNERSEKYASTCAKVRPPPHPRNDQIPYR